ncbi:MAG: AraC family ligand binding domain-containing protein, partial [Peptostreptococcaceae bacterium]|nr:AraC family ligand binding domain-containing protein [Peptostreptococcaceae bacterium]
MGKYKFVETESVAYLEPKQGQALDLFLCHSGTENCNPSYSFGPETRDHFIIHYILDGKGEFTVNNKTYKLGKKDGFLIKPGEETYYKADDKDPWIYMWIGFNGIKAETYLKYANLDENNHIFKYEKDSSLKKYILEILSLNIMNNSNRLKIDGLLYLFIGNLIENNKYMDKENSNTQVDEYINISIDFINNNYSNNIKVTDIANYVGLNRSYFSNLFTIDCQYKCNTLYSCCIKYLCRCLISKTLAR